MGREQELESLVEPVEGARQGLAGSLVVRGEPGAGQSALLDGLVSQASGLTVLRTQGLEAEAPWRSRRSIVSFGP